MVKETTMKICITAEQSLTKDTVNLTSINRIFTEGILVARGGIESPTQRFSTRLLTGLIIFLRSPVFRTVFRRNMNVSDFNCTKQRHSDRFYCLRSVSRTIGMAAWAD